MYVGRFAPSPTGPLHFGSLVAALASYLDARRSGGRWLLRMEDLDRARVERGAASAILRQLDALGLHWDGEVAWQSQREALYRRALDELLSRGLAYPCGCSRSEIADSAIGIDGARVYPGTCRDGLPPGKRARALRLRTTHEPVCFADRVQGAVRQDVESAVGDFVLFRADGMVAYQLAVVVDDAAQGVTHVTRGRDMEAATDIHVLLQALLGLPTPVYTFHELILDETGRKLAKSKGSETLRDMREAGWTAAAIRARLGFGT